MNMSSLYCFHVPSSSFPSSWNLSVSLALSGNDVKGAGAFLGPREKRHKSDFGGWLTTDEKRWRKTVMLFIFIVYFSSISACWAYVSGRLGDLLSSWSSTPEAPVFRLPFFLAPFCFSLYSPTSVWASSQNFTSVGWVWTSPGEMGHWLGPFFFLSVCS